jgi:hypothetical protein
MGAGRPGAASPCVQGLTDTARQIIKRNTYPYFELAAAVIAQEWEVAECDHSQGHGVHHDHALVH